MGRRGAKHFVGKRQNRDHQDYRDVLVWGECPPDMTGSVPTRILKLGTRNSDLGNGVGTLPCSHAWGVQDDRSVCGH